MKKDTVNNNCRVYTIDDNYCLLYFIDVVKISTVVESRWKKKVGMVFQIVMCMFRRNCNVITNHNVITNYNVIRVPQVVSNSGFSFK